MNKESKKNTPGRPRLEIEIQKRRNISLSDRLAEKAKLLGDGSVSAGIRRALEECDLTDER